MGVVDEVIVDDNDDAEEDKYDDNVGDAAPLLPPRVEDKNDQR